MFSIGSQARVLFSLPVLVSEISMTEVDNLFSWNLSLFFNDSIFNVYSYFNNVVGLKLEAYKPRPNGWHGNLLEFAYKC